MIYPELWGFRVSDGLFAKLASEYSTLRVFKWCSGSRASGSVVLITHTHVMCHKSCWIFDSSAPYRDLAWVAFYLHIIHPWTAQRESYVRAYWEKSCLLYVFKALDTMALLWAMQFLLMEVNNVFLILCPILLVTLSKTSLLTWFFSTLCIT